MDKEYYKNYFILEKDHWFFKIRRKILFYFIKKYVRPDAKVFDFGCGSGFLVGELQKQGFDASGSDTSQEAISLGKQKGIQNLEVVELGEMPQNGSYDAILALDVIEHIKDDTEVIRGLKNSLKSGGVLITTVPAYQWLWGVQDEVSHHFRRYVMRDFISVFNKFKELKVVRKTYFNTLLFPAIALVRLFSRWFDFKNRNSDFDIDNNFLSAVFYFVFNLETYLLKFMNFPFGVSMLVILKKK
ncbi:MAG: hypothetical protein COV30_01290 [Candidatus Yanofskybacteria bacterium CG10_big_fil_rev_8_21_14_0_10_37_15]|uniref:Methyltransferase type 11 domain-containing protein n=1 Tax=Candidatus Yanofskybacteria bacterium CG10_big_fil_rev_8_21_14_0_10_37_15 TaxID=1975097 RepID=A0A2H0R5Q5_9BACT|nr:MAG: hypothetical protein COV30_01290 [Candidatus Yanofskybacteria bacterium CG10_big_fil_rev_8_21_14_0_10_37_15]